MVNVGFQVNGRASQRSFDIDHVVYQCCKVTAEPRGGLVVRIILGILERLGTGIYG